jgi:hypothetical protein
MIMRNLCNSLLLIPALLLTMGLSNVYGDEDKSVKNLPEAVTKALEAHYPGAKVAHSEEHFDGQTKIFEIVLGSESDDEEDERVVSITAAGLMIEAHGPVALDSIPEKVQSTIKKLAKKAQVVGAGLNESHAKQVLVALKQGHDRYEIVVERNGQRAVLIFETDGTLLEGLLWDERDEPDMDEWDDDEGDDDEGEDDDQKMADDQDGDDDEEPMTEQLPEHLKGLLKKSYADYEHELLGVDEEHETVIFSVHIHKEGSEGLLRITKDGKLLTTQFPVMNKTLPEAITAVLNKIAKGAKIVECSKMHFNFSPQWVKRDAPVKFFEIELEQGERGSMMVLKADGTVIRGLRWERDDEGGEGDEDEGEDDEDDEEERKKL